MSDGGMGLGNFIWGPGGQRLSADEVARRRALASSLIPQQAPRDYWSGINSIVGNIGGALHNWQADQAEAAGRSEYEGMLAQALESGATDIASLAPLLTHDFASQGGSALGQALLNQTIQQSDPMYQLRLQEAQLGLERARNPFQATPATPDQLAPWGIAPQAGESWTIGPDGLPQQVFAPSSAPAPIEVGGVLVDPTTYQPVFDSRQNASPSNVQEYEYYAQQAQSLGEQPLPFDQWDLERRGRGASQINVGSGQYGTIPQGYQLITDPQSGAARLERIPGGPEDVEQVNEALIAVDTAESALGNIRGIIEDPNLGIAVGLGGMLPAIPNTPQAGLVSRIDQLQGTAFLQAFESLKGGGQITEIEGQRATDAIARLNRVQSQEDFVTALNDLGQIIHTGLNRARRSAGMEPLGSYEPVSPPQSSSGAISPVPQGEPLAQVNETGQISSSIVPQGFTQNPERWQSTEPPADWTGPEGSWNRLTPEARALWP